MPIKQVELERDILLNEAGQITDGDDNGHIAAIVYVDTEDKQYDEEIVADWKDPPDEVISMVNRVLAEKGIDLEFIHVGVGDDAYHFGVDKAVDQYIK